MGIDWGIVFGVASLLVLQIFFAVSAVFLFLSQKSQVNELREQKSHYVSAENTLKTANESLIKKLDKMEEKWDNLRKVKVDGWEDGDLELRAKIKSNTARISQLNRMITQLRDPGPEDDDAGDESYYNNGVGYEKQQTKPTLPENFGKAAI